MLTNKLFISLTMLKLLLLTSALLLGASSAQFFCGSSLLACFRYVNLLFPTRFDLHWRRIYNDHVNPSDDDLAQLAVLRETHKRLTLEVERKRKRISVHRRIHESEMRRLKTMKEFETRRHRSRIEIVEKFKLFI